MIKKVTVQNFRSLKNISLSFEEDITVIVGENDCGKSSVIDVVKNVFNNESVGLDDFYHGTNEIVFEIEIEDRTIIKKIKQKDEQVLSPEILIKISRDLITKINEDIQSESFELLGETEQKEKLKQYADDLGVKYAGNIGANTLKERVIKRIEEFSGADDSDLVISGKIPDSLIYFLDGKHFEDVKTFFSEMFFKNKKRGIWSEETESGMSIQDVIKSKLEEYSSNLSTEIAEKGIKDKLKSFLPELEGINIKSTFEPRDIQIDLKVQLLEESGEEINFDKKGDGTKRKITMALLEYGKEINKDLNPIYILDEPDTHLHVRSQIDLLKILRNFAENDAQVILTTHSPFILNSVDPRQVKLLVNNGETRLIPIDSDEEVERSLNALGIENLNLFFSRKILIVEGETEEKFIPIVQKRFFGVNLYNIMVKLVNRRSITDIPRFAEVLSIFVKPDDIYILTDNDGDNETIELIDNLEIDSENIFKVGTKEFEDSFESQIIYNAWKEFVENKGRTVGPDWSISNIEDTKKDCIDNGKKFSRALGPLNAKCGVRLRKPVLANALAEYIQESDLDDNIMELLQKIQ